MKTKNIKVSYSTHYGNHGIITVPKIHMEGLWLEKLGFSIGSTVAVEYGDGSITIRTMTEEEINTRKQQELSANIQRKEREHKSLHRQEELQHVAEAGIRYETFPVKSSRKSR